MIDMLLNLLPQADKPPIGSGGQGPTYPNPPVTYVPTNLGMCARGDFIYMCGGANAAGTIQRTTLKFNIVSKTWTQLPDVPAAITSPRYHSMSVVGDKIYIITGQTLLGILDTTTDTWSTRALTLPYGYKLGCGSVTMGNLIFHVGGGVDVVSYDPINNVWKRYSNLPYSRSYGSVTCIGTTLYAWSGYIDGGATDDTLYHLDTVLDDGWKITTIKQPMANAAKLLNYNDRLFSATGWAGSVVNPLIREIAPSAGVIGTNGVTNNPRLFGAYVMTHNGKIWYYGGNVNTPSGPVTAALTEYGVGTV